MSKPHVWKTRNSLYLRVSPSSVLQLLIYLDPRHVDWMSTRILESVLLELKGRISAKLKKDLQAGSKKSVDVFRGADYQLAFFFRRTAQKHAVLLKHRELVHEPLKPEPKEDEDDEPQADRSRRKRRAQAELDEEPSAKRVREDTVIKEEEDVEVTPLGSIGGTEHDPLAIEDDDEKKNFKPRLKVSYAGFSIFGRTLVVVVEPYPPLRETPAPDFEPPEIRQLSELPEDRARSRSRSTSVMAPPNRASPRASTSRRRSETPLFRAETPLRSETPAALSDDPTEAGDTGELQFLRARSQSLAHDPFAPIDLDDDSDGDLPPSVHEIIRAREPSESVGPD